MLRDSDVWLKSHFGSGFLLNNLVVLSLIHISIFTIFPKSSVNIYIDGI